MTETPQRRWFQWRLSTWLVLVAILCGLMATGAFVKPPRFDFSNYPRFVTLQLGPQPSDSINFSDPAGLVHNACLLGEWVVSLFHTNAMFPAFALFAFIAWRSPKPGALSRTTYVCLLGLGFVLTFILVFRLTSVFAAGEPPLRDEIEWRVKQATIAIACLAAAFMLRRANRRAERSLLQWMDVPA